ncbi:RRXRR domain-containing protein, partial [Vreelandella rituensis]|uniref:RRXRR domain-containing protein n=1 Tax=Vreelandella rituensis TaxID=2282306 RepID=UPI0039EDFED2
MAVFVLGKKKQPLMPCSEKRAQLLLERGRAAVVNPNRARYRASPGPTALCCNAVMATATTRYPRLNTKGGA